MTDLDTAYNEGANASDRSVDADENPYNPLVEPTQNREWRRGYEDNSPGGCRYEWKAPNKTNTTRSYQVSLFGAGGGVLDSQSFDAHDDMQDVGAAAAEIAIRMIREAGYLSPGDRIVFVEIES